MSTVVLSVYKVANFPDGGGHFWVYLQYAQALRRLGCEVYWLEQLRPLRDPEREPRLLDAFLARMERFGLRGRTLLYRRERPQEGDPGALEFVGCTRSDAEAVLRRADLLLNFHYAIDHRLLSCARRTALVDIDPGLLQVWMSTGELAVPPHDCYLTTGETVGTPSARFSDCGLRWMYVGRPVCLEDWPAVFDSRCAAFTTVSSWSGASWLRAIENGKPVLRENTKRVAFLPFIDLPRHTTQPLELALYLVEHKDAADRSRLLEHGWRLRDSREVAGTPEAYQAYIQRSRGEFSCAKPSCMDLQNAWISDRTLCYLASGKPAVVQDTGPSAYLPHGEGMFRFTSLHDAAGAFEEINADYARHCRAARDIVETHFDAARVLTTMLNAALGSGAATRPTTSAGVP